MVARDGDVLLNGERCPACGFVSATPLPWCPQCRGPVVEVQFGPAGTVWSSTVVRIAVGDRQPPFALAYVDLDDGPRVLAHAPGVDDSLRIGQRVRLIDVEGTGDVRIEVDA